MSKKTVKFEESHQPISAVVRVDCHRKISSEYTTGGNHRTTLRVVRVDTHRRIVSKTIHSDRTHIVPPVMWQHMLTRVYQYKVWSSKLIQMAWLWIHCRRTHPLLICMYAWLYVCMYIVCMYVRIVCSCNNSYSNLYKVRCVHVCKLHYQYNLHHCIYMYMYTKTRESYCTCIAGKFGEGFNLAIWCF